MTGEVLHAKSSYKGMEFFIQVQQGPEGQEREEQSPNVWKLLDDSHCCPFTPGIYEGWRRALTGP